MTGGTKAGRADVLADEAELLELNELDELDELDDELVPEELEVPEPAVVELEPELDALEPDVPLEADEEPVPVELVAPLEEPVEIPAAA